MNIHFCSCIPRSGSTLLLNLLGQNPVFHVTPTNDLIELLIKVRDYWMEQIAFKAQGLKGMETRVLKTMYGMIDGFYTDEFAAGKMVIDKSRTWIGYINLIERILERKIKIIVPVRAVEDVLASFEQVHRKSSLTEHAYNGPLHALRQSVVGRAQSFLAPEAHLGMMLTRLRDALACGYQDRLLIVPYRDLTNKPLEIVNWITRELKLPAFKYDPENVTQITHEDDTLYGMELHKIREGRIEPQSSYAHKMLPREFINWVQQEYSDINALAISKNRYC